MDFTDITKCTLVELDPDTGVVTNIPHTGPYIGVCTVVGNKIFIADIDNVVLKYHIVGTEPETDIIILTYNGTSQIEQVSYNGISYITDKIGNCVDSSGNAMLGIATTDGSILKSAYLGLQGTCSGRTMPGLPICVFSEVPPD